MTRLIIALVIVLFAVGSLAVLNHSGTQNWLMGRVVAQTMSVTPKPVTHLRVVVCGSASPLGNDPERAQACIAVLTPDHFLLIDTGAGSPARLGGLPLERLDAVFLTHFHSDHIAALPDVALRSWVSGRTAPLTVHGPRGVRDVVDGFNRAYRLDRHYRVTHHSPAFLPPDAGTLRAAPFDSDTGVIWRDGDLAVTAFSVAHSPVSPAVGYRVDYGGRSVVVSGDTIATASLEMAASGADLLFHDALSRPMLDIMIEGADTAGRTRVAKVMRDVIDYHADASTLEALAARAGVRRLVLYHLVPTPPNRIARSIFARGLDSRTLLASDLMTFDLPADSDEILITNP